MLKKGSAKISGIIRTKVKIRRMSVKKGSAEISGIIAKLKVRQVSVKKALVRSQ